MNFVRLAIGFYVFVGAATAVLLWRNSANPDALKNAGILFAGVIPALIAILPYLTQRVDTRRFEYALFYDNNLKRVVPIGTYDPYIRAYHSVFANLKNEDFLADAAKTQTDYWAGRGLDLIERAILIEIAAKFQLHWNVQEFSSKLTPTGETTRFNLGLDQPQQKIEMKDVRKVFAYNELISKPEHDLIFPSFSLPPCGTIHAKKSDSNVPMRTIIIDSCDMRVTITITPSASGGLPGGVWGIVGPSAHLGLLEYSVETQAKFERAKQTSETKLYERWVANLNSALDKFDWSNVDNEAEKLLMRQMLERQRVVNERGAKDH
jgi:hypothetical protein